MCETTIIIIVEIDAIANELEDNFEKEVNTKLGDKATQLKEYETQVPLLTEENKKLTEERKKLSDDLFKAQTDNIELTRAITEIGLDPEDLETSSNKLVADNLARTLEIANLNVRITNLEEEVNKEITALPNGQTLTSLITFYQHNVNHKCDNVPTDYNTTKAELNTVKATLAQITAERNASQVAYQELIGNDGLDLEVVHEDGAGRGQVNNIKLKHLKTSADNGKKLAYIFPELLDMNNYEVREIDLTNLRNLYRQVKNEGDLEGLVDRDKLIIDTGKIKKLAEEAGEPNEAETKLAHSTLIINNANTKLGIDITTDDLGKKLDGAKDVPEAIRQAKELAGIKTELDTKKRAIDGKADLDTANATIATQEATITSQNKTIADAKVALGMEPTARLDTLPILLNNKTLQKLIEDSNNLPQIQADLDTVNEEIITLNTTIDNAQTYLNIPNLTAD
ncbi:2542_t:CDS:2, partial [Ambispora gerdemannii]